MTDGRYVLLGAPGAGKGTQAQLVCQRRGLTHLSTGDLLRAAVQAGTAAGLAAKQHMEAGRLVPDDVVFEVLFERLGAAGSGRAASGGFLLDGFPRNRAQAEELDRRLAALGTPLDRVADLTVPDAILLQRLTGRRSCRGCGRSFHLDFLPPRAAGLCDGCGGPLEQRSDDTAAVVSERLAVYRRQTAPLREFYASRGLLVSVDGHREVGVVADELLARLVPLPQPQPSSRRA
ncbi:MAG: adenylate kinase [Planctomycetota bacterium]